MRIAVLGSPASWYFSDLCRAAAGEHELVAATFADLHATVDQRGVTVGSAGLELNSFDGVLVRNMPPGSLEQVVFRMDALAGVQSAGVPVLNPPKAVEAAVDKHLTLARLHAAGLPVPRTVTCQTAAHAAAAFDALGRDVVLKPIFGGEGRGITRLQDPVLALRAFRLLEQLGSVVYLQEFIPHPGEDLRLLVLGDEVLGMRRVNPDDWRTNISRGARGEPLEVTPELAGLAQDAARAVGAPLAGVDVLHDRDGRPMVIEVNAVPGWRALAGVTGVDVAERVLRLLTGAGRG